jgi:hypothetical protein
LQQGTIRLAESGRPPLGLSTVTAVPFTLTIRRCLVVDVNPHTGIDAELGNRLSLSCVGQPALVRGRSAADALADAGERNVENIGAQNPR